MGRPILRRLLPILALSAVAACAAVTEDDAEGTDKALIGSYDTPDPNNRWMQAIEPGQMKIGQENVLPNEGELFTGFANGVTGMQRRLAAINGGPARGFHAKAHACVKGELHV